MDEMNASELREALRQANTRADGKRVMSDAQIDADVEKIVQMRERMKPVCDEHGAPLPPEEQIKRNPALALDIGPALRRKEMITELLRWMHRPEMARGKRFYVPKNHPSGLGGLTIYVPEDFPLPSCDQVVNAMSTTTKTRVTLDDIEVNISSEHYFTAYQGDVKAVEEQAFAAGNGAMNLAASRSTPDALRLLTFCVLILRNGFTVTGESACVDPASFNAAIGRKVARQNAIAKVWPLMGYALKTELSQQSS